MNFRFENGEVVEFDDCVISYLKDKIAHNMAYKTVQPNGFDRRKYKFMIMKVITMRVNGKSYKEIGENISRTYQRASQITHHFFKRLKWCVEHNNQPILRSDYEQKTK